MTDPGEVSALFHALAHPHRRVVLYYLDEHGEASLATLADCVTGWVESGPGADALAASVMRGKVGSERGKISPARGETDHGSVAVQLRHVHLPVLADAGLVTYDPGSESVTLTELSSTADALLAAALRADVEGGHARREHTRAGNGGETASERDDDA